jgi:RNA-directed DNA polymerase
VLLEHSTKLVSLRKAWSKVRANGLGSTVKATVTTTKDFDRNAEYRLKQIQKKIRTQTFKFAPQLGILKSKGPGKGFRGIVVSPLENRIVERALLDCLQEKVPFVTNVLDTPSSIGGVPNRGVGHGLSLVHAALNQPNAYFIRSDISGFFDNICRSRVIEILSQHISEPEFLDLLSDACTVILDNEIQLGENRRVFPEGDNGVAQGSPLSALFGNILLHEFDTQFNDRGITCVRFIDDFVLIGEERKVKKAFRNATKYLSDIGLSCHDPFDRSVSKQKAQHGSSDQLFIFLGYELNREIRRPSPKAQSDLISNVQRHLDDSKIDIQNQINRKPNTYPNKKYIQTLFLIDKIVLGWGHAFSYSSESFSKIDSEINKRLLKFNDWFKNTSSTLNGDLKRRILGVSLLKDIPVRQFCDLPFAFKKLKHHPKSKNCITVSTDGSRVPYESGANRAIGHGGWAAIFHDPYDELVGYEPMATNNGMELRAVVEALKYTKKGERLHIRTDSQYIFRTTKEGGMVRENITLWREIESLCSERLVSFEWVKAHSGDEFNELADKLANAQANMFR